MTEKLFTIEKTDSLLSLFEKQLFAAVVLGSSSRVSSPRRLLLYQRKYRRHSLTEGK